MCVCVCVCVCVWCVFAEYAGHVFLSLFGDYNVSV